MRDESNIAPVAPYEIESRDDGKVDIRFFENVEEIEEDRYAFDVYRITVQQTPNLIERIEDNIAAWLSLAKEQEEAQKGKTYADRVVQLVREKYSVDDELAIQRQKDVKPDEWNAYNDYVEQCKATARAEIFG